MKHLNDYRVVVVPAGREGANSVFDKLEEVEDTDVLLVSVRFRLPPQWQTKQRLEPQNPSGGLRSPAASPCFQP